MGLGGTFRRLRAEAVVAAATLLTVALSLVLLAAGPIYSEAVSVGALRRTLVDAPTSSTAVDVSIRAQRGEVESLENVATGSIGAAFDRVAFEAYRSLTSSRSFELPDQPNADRADLASFVWLEAVDSEITVTSGTMPTPTEDVISVMIETDAAQALGLDVGRRLTLVLRSGSAQAVMVEVSGHYRVNNRFGPFWHGRERIVESLTLSPLFRTVSMITTREAMLTGLFERPQVGTLVIPRFDGIGVDEVVPLRANLAGLEEEINGRLAIDVPDTTSEFEVTTSAPSMLERRGRTLTVARSVIIAVVAQLAVLGAFALVLVAGLGVDARKAEAVTLRARGASATQLLTQALLDAVAIVLPVAVAAPYLAAWLVGFVDQFGPLGAADLMIAPRVVGESWVIVGLAGVGIVVLLSWPAFRAARTADASTQRRRRLAGGLQRSGIDVAVLALAIVTYWQLRTLGDDRAATVRGRFGVDPLLIAAPTLGLVAGAFIALRVVPAGARMAERAIGGSRSATLALSGWQLARRPDRYTRTGLLLIMAVAIGTFATAYETTWTASQTEQAVHEIGAGGQVVPNRRTEDSIGPLQLISALEAVPGVERAMAVVDAEIDLPVSTRPARLIALAADQPEVLVDNLGSGDDVAAALARLADRRPSMVGVELPGEPVRFDLTLDVSPADPPPGSIAADGVDEEQEVEVPLAGSVSVLLRDGDGVLHRVDAGQLGVGRLTRNIDLTVDSSSTPTYPLSIIDIQFSTVTQSSVDRDVLVAVEPVELTDSSGLVTLVALDETSWLPRSEVLGFLSQPAALAFSARAPTGGLGIRITSGSALLTVPVIHSVAPSNTEPPIGVPRLPLAGIATASWMETSATNVGDLVPVPLGRGDDVLIEITGVVAAAPTIDPGSADALLVDLPTLMWLERGPGRPVRTISEYWITIDDGSISVDDALRRPPVEAVDVHLLIDRQLELTSNPPALTVIGAMTVGSIAAAVFAVAGFVVTVMVSARERSSEFALLYALGLTARQHRRWMLAEQIALVVASLAIGTLLGLGLSRLVLPVVSLAQDGTSVYPEVTVLYPWRRIMALELSLIGGLVLGMVGVRLLRGRSSIGSALRGVGGS